MEKRISISEINKELERIYCGSLDAGSYIEGLSVRLSKDGGSTCASGDLVPRIIEEAEDFVYGHDLSVIYYENAMKYLMEKDPSLRRSIAIAESCGYSLRELDSERLVTLLSYEEERGEFIEAISRIADMVSEYDVIDII